MFHLQNLLSAFQVGVCLGTSITRVALGPGHSVRLPGAGGRGMCAGGSAPDTPPGRPTWMAHVLLLSTPGQQLQVRHAGASQSQVWSLEE